MLPVLPDALGHLPLGPLGTPLLKYVTSCPELHPAGAFWLLEVSLGLGSGLPSSTPVLALLQVLYSFMALLRQCTLVEHTFCGCRPSLGLGHKCTFNMKSGLLTVYKSLLMSCPVLFLTFHQGSKGNAGENTAVRQLILSQAG